MEEAKLSRRSVKFNEDDNEIAYLDDKRGLTPNVYLNGSNLALEL